MHAYRLPLSVALVSITTPVHLMVRHRSGDPGPLAVPCAEEGRLRSGANGNLRPLWCNQEPGTQEPTKPTPGR